LDTLDRILSESKIVDRAKLDAYQPDQKADAERAEWRTLFLDRLFRTVRTNDENR